MDFFGHIIALSEEHYVYDTLTNEAIPKDKSYDPQCIMTCERDISTPEGMKRTKQQREALKHVYSKLSDNISRSTWMKTRECSRNSYFEESVEYMWGKVYIQTGDNFSQGYFLNPHDNIRGFKQAPRIRLSYNYDTYPFITPKFLNILKSGIRSNYKELVTSNQQLFVHICIEELNSNSGQVHSLSRRDAVPDIYISAESCMDPVTAQYSIACKIADRLEFNYKNTTDAIRFNYLNSNQQISIYMQIQHFESKYGVIGVSFQKFEKKHFINNFGNSKSFKSVLEQYQRKKQLKYLSDRNMYFLNNLKDIETLADMELKGEFEKVSEESSELMEEKSFKQQNLIPESSYSIKYFPVYAEPDAYKDPTLDERSILELTKMIS